jgi:hypothetical protein
METPPLDELGGRRLDGGEVSGHDLLAKRRLEHRALPNPFGALASHQALPQHGKKHFQLRRPRLAVVAVVALQDVGDHRRAIDEDRVSTPDVISEDVSEPFSGLGLQEKRIGADGGHR